MTAFLSPFSIQSKRQTSALQAHTTTPFAPISARGSWRSWRRSSTSASTWRVRGAWRSPPLSSSTRRRWKSGSRTDAWSRRSARGRGRPLQRAPPPPPPLVPTSTRSWRTPIIPQRPHLRVPPRTRRRRQSKPRDWFCTCQSNIVALWKTLSYSMIQYLKHCILHLKETVLSFISLLPLLWTTSAFSQL